MKKCTNILLATALLGFITHNAAAQQSMLITGATVHTAAGRIIDDGAVGVREGRIDYVGSAVNAPSGYDTVLTRAGMRLYPGLIAPNTTLGLNEIFSVRATRDYSEAGSMNPNVRALIAYNAESDITATVLANGVVLAQICPRGGTISGTSSVVQLHALNWEEAAYHPDEGIHMGWPAMFKAKSDEEDDPQGFSFDPTYNERRAELYQFFTAAKAYKPNGPVRDLKMEALTGIFSGDKTLYVRCDFIKEIREVVQFKRELGIPNLCIVGGYDSWMAAELLRENNISVLVRRINSLPRFAEDPIDDPYVLPARLSKAQVRFAFQMDGDMETMQNRNLAFNAGTAMGYGLSEEEALRACTLYPATILGIADRTGSIEKGKDANLILTRGDLFEIRYGGVVEIYIMGQRVIPENRQDMLYQKYRSIQEKYRPDADSSPKSR
jgi:imidazolonepropionase-like amidohydrolase